MGVNRRQQLDGMLDVIKDIEKRMNRANTVASTAMQKFRAYKGDDVREDDRLGEAVDRACKTAKKLNEKYAESVHAYNRALAEWRASNTTSGASSGSRKLL